MRAVTLLYHDVIEDGRFDESGRPGATAQRYKMSLPLFEAHLAAIAHTGTVPVTALQPRPTVADAPARLMLTFDDGGSSGHAPVAPLLEKLGWRGHFFVTASQIGERGFLSPGQIRELHARGHVIGSHTFSHPERMSHLGWEDLVAEWRTSVQMLGDIIGERVHVGSVPGGYYSAKVARAALTAGIDVLFTSEPVTVVRRVAGCDVFGRYSLHGDSPADLAGRLAAFEVAPRMRQWIEWNVKKSLKRLGGTSYIRASEQVFRLRQRGRA